MSEVKVHLEKDNQVVIVLPDDTVIYTTAEALLTLSGKKENNYQPPVPEKKKFFTEEERKGTLRYLRDSDVESIEQFLEDYKHLFSSGTLKSKEFYGIKHGCVSNRGFVYVDCYGNTFATVRDMGERYQVDLRNISTRNSDTVTVPSILGNYRSLWHLNFKDHRGIKVSAVRILVDDLFISNDDLSTYEKAGGEQFFKRAKFEKFMNYIIAVKAAREHVDD